MDNTTPQAIVPTTQTTGRMIDAAAFTAILNKRITVQPTDVGSSLLFQIQGTGQFLQKGHKYAVAGEQRENGFDRTIYNVRAQSSILMTLPENKQLLKEAMIAESTGNMQEAHDKFNAYLNNVQLSFSVIMPSTRVFNSGDDIKGRVASVVSKAGITSLQLEDVSYVAPKVKAAVKFSITDLIEA